MALYAFGPAIDVQAGGADLRFPHHAYQAAMAEVFTGVTPFARARLNAGVVRVAGAKMAKSAGNLVLVKDLLASYPAAAVRLLILDRPWHEDWDYDRAGLDAAAARLERIAAAAGRPGRSAAGHDDAAISAVRAALARTSTCPRPCASPKRRAAPPPAPSPRCSPSGNRPAPAVRPPRLDPGRSLSRLSWGAWGTGGWRGLLRRRCGTPRSARSSGPRGWGSPGRSSRSP